MMKHSKSRQIVLLSGLIILVIVCLFSVSIVSRHYLIDTTYENLRVSSEKIYAAVENHASHTYLHLLSAPYPEIENEESLLLLLEELNASSVSGTYFLKEKSADYFLEKTTRRCFLPDRMFSLQSPTSLFRLFHLPMHLPNESPLFFLLDSYQIIRSFRF